MDLVKPYQVNVRRYFSEEVLLFSGGQCHQSQRDWLGRWSDQSLINPTRVYPFVKVCHHAGLWISCRRVLGNKRPKKEAPPIGPSPFYSLFDNDTDYHYDVTVHVIDTFGHFTSGLCIQYQERFLNARVGRWTVILKEY